MHALRICTLTLMACAEPSPDAHDSAAPAGPAPCHQCALVDDHNFSYAAALRIPLSTVSPGANAVIDWSALETDVQGHSLSAAGGVDQVSLVLFLALTPEEIQARLAADSLSQSDVTLYVTCDPDGATTCSLDDFGVFGAEIDVKTYFEDGRGTWLAALTSDATRGAHSFALIQASADADSDSVLVTDGAATLDVDVDFDSGARLVVPPQDPNITVDWSALTTDGLGNEMALFTLNRLLLARYTDDLDALSGRIFDLETLPAEQWSLDITGRTDAALTDVSGDTVFAGLDSESTWLLALWCDSVTCLNPAPRFVAVMESAP